MIFISQLINLFIRWFICLSINWLSISPSIHLFLCPLIHSFLIVFNTHLCDVPLKLPPSLSWIFAKRTPVTKVQLINSWRVNVTSKCNFFFGLRDKGRDAPSVEVKLSILLDILLQLSLQTSSSPLNSKAKCSLCAWHQIYIRVNTLIATPIFPE